MAELYLAILMSRVHPRMPVILHTRDYDRWLDREETEWLPQSPPALESDEMEMFEAHPNVGKGPRELLGRATVAAESGELPF